MKSIGSFFVVTLIIILFSYCLGIVMGSKKAFPYQQMWAVKSFFVSPPLLLFPNIDGESQRAQFKLFHPVKDIVFIGDSITASGNWQEIFPAASISNRAIFGDKTSDILERIDTILLTRPKKAFIMVGINDLKNGRNVNLTFKNYILIIEKLKVNNVQVIVISALECEKVKCGWVLFSVRELNKKIKAYANNNHITYVDLNESFSTIEDGLRKENTEDGIHLLGNQYLIWAKLIKPYIV